MYISRTCAMYFLNNAHIVSIINMFQMGRKLAPRGQVR